MANTSVFNTDDFTSIAIGKDGDVWAGTFQKGLYKLSSGTWQKSPLLDNAFIYDIKADKNGGIWVGQAGTDGLVASGGGLEYFADSQTNERVHYGAVNGLPTRFVRSVFIDTSGADPLPKIWTANVNTQTGGEDDHGGIGRGLNQVSGNNAFSTIREGLELKYGTGACRAIGGNSKQVWAYVPDNDTGKSQLLVYDAETKNHLSTFDTGNVPGLDRRFVAKTIYGDRKNRIWIGMDDGHLLVFNGTIARLINLADLLGQTFSINFITEDYNGVIYLGSSKGLFMYMGGDAGMAHSYIIPTPTNKLPADNIKSIACVGPYAWLATDAGIKSMATFEFSAYTQENATTNDPNNADLLTTATSSFNINVAADNSNATLIVYAGSGVNDATLKVRDHPEVNIVYTPEYGQLTEIKRSSDSLVYLYHHPQYVFRGDKELAVTYPIEIINSTGDKIISGNLNVYHVPVLLVHGVWSSNLAFEKIANNLVQKSGNYYSWQVMRIKFDNPKHPEYKNSEEVFKDWVPNSIRELLNICRSKRLSAGKVAVIGHSRGGLFGRYYAQGTFVSYKGDMYSLTTINSPHYGSQAANLVLDDRAFIFNALKLGETARGLILEDHDYVDGAFGLRVNSPAILKRLNKWKPPSPTVPAHAIVSTIKLTITKKEITESDKGPQKSSVSEALRALILAAGNLLEGPAADALLNALYNNEENDIVVPLSSQKGGLQESAITRINGYAHSNKHFGHWLSLEDAVGILDAPITSETLISLLRLNPFTNDAFSKNWFKGSDMLEYKFFTLLYGANKYPNNFKAEQQQSIKLDEASLLKTYKFGDTLSIKVKGTDSISKILLSYYAPNLSGHYSDIGDGKNYTFKFPVPKEAIGTINIIAYGFSDNGLKAIDTGRINIGLNSNTKLDSIRLQPNGEKDFAIHTNESVEASILGYFSDTMRNITGFPGIKLSVSGGSIAAISATGKVKGLVPNTAGILYAEYQGKQDSILLRVEDSLPLAADDAPVLPVILQSFTAGFNKEVVLKWSTVDEANSSSFDIEYSTDGVHFVKIGNVPAYGTGGIHTYDFNTTQFSQGINYYRLKQFDRDGHYIYSVIRAVKVGEAFAGIVYPNPSSRKLTIRLTQPVNSNALLFITNMSGQLIYKKNIDEATKQINITLPVLSNGVYILTLENPQHVKILSQKVVIQ